MFSIFLPPVLFVIETGSAWKWINSHHVRQVGGVELLCPNTPDPAHSPPSKRIERNHGTPNAPRNPFVGQRLPGKSTGSSLETTNSGGDTADAGSRAPVVEQARWELFQEEKWCEKGICSTNFGCLFSIFSFFWRQIPSVWLADLAHNVSPDLDCRSSGGMFFLSGFWSWVLFIYLLKFRIWWTFLCLWFSNSLFDWFIRCILVEQALWFSAFFLS